MRQDDPHTRSAASELTVASPRIPLDIVVSCLRSLYDIECRALERLGGESDQNYRAEDVMGNQYVCKIAHPSAEEEVLDLQSHVLRHLETAAPQLPVQRVIRTRDGKDSGRLEASEDMAIVRLYSYLPGTPMHQAPASSALCRSLGVLHAELCSALASWPGSLPERDFLWDLSKADRVEALLPHLQDPEKRQLAAHYLDLYEAKAKRAQAALPRQLIHGDLNPHNLLVDDQATEPVGVLDFGDVNSAPVLNDIAIAASYFMATAGHSPGHSLTRVNDYLDGFSSIRPLSPEEASILFPLITTRMVMTLAISEWRAALHPTNRAYILKNNASAWAGLSHAASLTEEEAHQQLAQAGRTSQWRAFDSPATDSEGGVYDDAQRI